MNFRLVLKVLLGILCQLMWCYTRWMTLLIKKKVNTHKTDGQSSWITNERQQYAVLINTSCLTLVLFYCFTDMSYNHDHRPLYVIIKVCKMILYAWYIWLISLALVRLLPIRSAHNKVAKGKTLCVHTLRIRRSWIHFNIYPMYINIRFQIQYRIVSNGMRNLKTVGCCCWTLSKSSIVIILSWCGERAIILCVLATCADAWVY